jgi:hypothetical protein
LSLVISIVDVVLVFITGVIVVVDVVNQSVVAVVLVIIIGIGIV